MILSEISDYIRLRGSASLQDILLKFDIDEQTARQILALLVKKGRIAHSRITASCGNSCNRCSEVSTEIYNWKDGDATVRVTPPDCTG